MTDLSAQALLGIPALGFVMDLQHLRIPCEFVLQKEEIRRLEQRIQEAEVQNAMLKQRLVRSDQQRMEGQQKIQHLRHEFMDVQARMPQRRTAGTPLTARRAGTNNTAANAGVPAANEGDTPCWGILICYSCFEIAAVVMPCFACCVRLGAYYGWALTMAGHVPCRCINHTVSPLPCL